MVEWATVRSWLACAALSIALCGCSSSGATTGGTTTGGASTNAGGTTGGGTTGGTTGGGTTGGTTSGGLTDGGVGDGGPLVNAVKGPLGFTVVFAGLLYNTFDGGADLTDVDFRLTDGIDSTRLPACNLDAGSGTPAENSVDIYLFNAPPISTLHGTYPVGYLPDGAYAQLYRSQRDPDAGLLFTLQASNGTVQCLAGGEAGAAGTFQASFLLDAGYSTISGSFNVPFCGSLSGN